MPNLFSAFTSEVFRPLVTLLIPGAVAISTWFIALLWQFPVLKKTVYENHAETGFVLAFAMTFAGMVLEDLGTRVEKRLDDKREGETGNHNANWFAYLRTAFVTDPIGRRYIRTLVLRLKFELGAGFVMVFAALGILWLWHLGLSYQVALINLGICGGSPFGYSWRLVVHTRLWPITTRIFWAKYALFPTHREAPPGLPSLATVTYRETPTKG